jgi:periplasmic protein TonB
MHSYRLPEARAELPLSVLLGAGVALGLFMLMAVAQMIGDVFAPDRTIDETLMAFNPPEVEVEVEPPPPKEEPPPELEEEPPQLSLDQLDLVLNPGTGGSLLGDFSLPTIDLGNAQQVLDEFVDFANLDQTPHPIGVTGFNFPARLLKKKVSGKIVLLLKLNELGEVLDAQVEASNLPEFDSFVLGAVKRWKFTAPTQQGRPVQAKARLPIPITIN